MKELEKRVSCAGSTAAPSGARSNVGSTPSAHVPTFVTVKGWVVDYAQKNVQAKSKEVLMAWLKDDVVPQLSQEIAASVDLEGTELLNSYATLFKMDIAIRGGSSCCRAFKNRLEQLRLAGSKIEQCNSCTSQVQRQLVSRCSLEWAGRLLPHTNAMASPRTLWSGSGTRCGCTSAVLTARAVQKHCSIHGAKRTVTSS